MQNIGLRSSGINGQNLGFKSDKAVSTLTFLPSSPFFFRFSCLMAMGKVLRKRCVMEQQTVTSQAVEGTWFRKGGYGQPRGEWIHFAIFPQSRKTWNLTRTPNKENPVFLVRRLYKRGGRQVERRRGGKGGGGGGGMVTVSMKESESVSETISFCALRVYCHFIKL